MSSARYDGVADWYDRVLATGEGATKPRAAALRLLGPASGRLLDVGCGTGTHTAAFAAHGWQVRGVDISEDQLRLARDRGLDVVQADVAELPFEEASFDAVVSMWTHTDVDNFSALLRALFVCTSLNRSFSNSKRAPSTRRYQSACSGGMPMRSLGLERATSLCSLSASGEPWII